MAKQIPDWFEPFKNQITWQEFNQNLHIDLVNKYLYVETPKVACSTIKARLHTVVIRNLPVPNEPHPEFYSSPFVKPFQLPDEQMDEILYGDEYYRFSFVREPVERVLSAYLDKVQRPMPQRERFFKRFLPEKAPDYDLSFSEFVGILSTIESYRDFDKHWRPQYGLLFLPDIKYHFLGSLDRFDDDWGKVTRAIGLGDGSQDTRVVSCHATSARDKLREYVTEDALVLLREVYKDDFSLHSKISGSDRKNLNG